MNKPDDKFIGKWNRYYEGIRNVVFTCNCIQATRVFTSSLRGTSTPISPFGPTADKNLGSQNREDQSRITYRPMELIRLKSSNLQGADKPFSFSGNLRLRITVLSILYRVWVMELSRERRINCCLLERGEDWRDEDEDSTYFGSERYERRHGRQKKKKKKKKRQRERETERQRWKKEHFGGYWMKKEKEIW